MPPPKKENSIRLEIGEILNNAISSIQLGIEDYETSRTTPARAISAARNIYAGVLLLFKYKIASLAKTQEQAIELIFKPQSILPSIDNSGDIKWKPKPHSKDTIDTSMIKARLESLSIYHDWNVVTRLRNSRNALEHLHPTDPTSKIQALIADLFPMLQKFITEELYEAPAALLGRSWSKMLETHEFLESNRSRIQMEWDALKLPESARILLISVECRACGSSLLQPCKADVDASIPINVSEFRYECLACHQTESLIEMLEAEFALAHEPAFVTDDNYELIRECNSCYIRMFLIDDSTCHWCGATNEWPKCHHCSKPVSALVRDHGGGLCDRCSEDEWLLQNR